MPPTRSQRNGATLEEIRAAVLLEYGPGARIVAAERVTTGGVAGLFRKAHVEATVEVPDPFDPPVARVAIADGPATRVGIAALLADADAAEARIAATDGTATTRADTFASVLDGFAADGIAPPRPVRRPDGGGPGLPSGSVGEPVTADRPVAAPVVPATVGPADAPVPSVTALPAGPASASASVPADDGPELDARAALLAAVAPRAAGRPPVPAVRSADGDLVLLVGRRADVDAAAAAFAMRHDLRGTDASDRRSGILARAEAVRDGVALLAGAAWTDTASVAGLAPDQVWVVVDVGRKHEDTVAVMQAVVEAGAAVVGVVAIGADETATPGTVHLLGVPVMSL